MKPTGLDRDAALAATPERTPVVRTGTRADGGLRVTVRIIPPRFMRWFGGRDAVERTYGLDPLGRELYEACDGKADVAGIIRAFQARHKVSAAEAELAVTTFLRTLVARGLVAMAVPKDRLRTRGER